MNQEELIKGKWILSCYNGFYALVPTVGLVWINMVYANYLFYLLSLSMFVIKIEWKRSCLYILFYSSLFVFTMILKVNDFLSCFRIKCQDNIVDKSQSVNLTKTLTIILNKLKYMLMFYNQICILWWKQTRS